MSQPNDLAASIAHDRYFLRSSHEGLQKILLDLDKVLQKLQSAEHGSEDVLDTLGLVHAGVRELQVHALEPIDFSNWKNIREHLLDVIRLISSTRLHTKSEEFKKTTELLLLKIGSAINEYQPTPTKKLSTLSFDAVLRSLNRVPRAALPVASLLAGLAIKTGATAPSVEKVPEKQVVRYHEVILEQPKKEIIDEAEVDTAEAKAKAKEKQEFIEKIKNQIATGKFSFEEYFDELESKFENVSDEDTKKAHIKFQEILNEIKIKFAKQSDRDFLKNTSAFIRSPKDKTDNRNTRASSNELLADRDTIGNCEARARATYRLIKKARPELAAKIKVAIWREHEALVYIDKSGEVYQIEAGTEWKIPKKLLKNLPLRTPMDAWVHSLLDGEIGTGTEQSNSSIQISEPDAPRMTELLSLDAGKERVRRDGLEMTTLVGRDTKNEEKYGHFFLQSKNMSELSADNIQEILKNSKNFHHITEFSVNDDMPEGGLVDTEKEPVFHYDISPIIDVLSKSPIKILNFDRRTSHLYQLSDFSKLKQLSELELLGSFDDANEIINFLNNHNIQDLRITSKIFSRIISGTENNIPESIKRLKKISINEGSDVSLFDVSKKILALRTEGFVGEIQINYNGQVLDSSEALEKYIEVLRVVDSTGAVTNAFSSSLKNISSMTNEQISRLIAMPSLSNLGIIINNETTSTDFARIKKIINVVNAKKQLTIYLNSERKGDSADVVEIRRLCAKSGYCWVMHVPSDPPERLD